MILKLYTLSKNWNNKIYKRIVIVILSIMPFQALSQEGDNFTIKEPEEISSSKSVFSLEALDIKSYIERVELVELSSLADEELLNFLNRQLDWEKEYD